MQRFCLYDCVCLYTSVTTENVYIATLPEIHCPWEYTAEEACLTLQWTKYAYDPSLYSQTLH